MTPDDLMKFCRKDTPNLSAPWSGGAYSYASNGHILVRVSRMEDVSERELAPKRSDVLFNVQPPEMFPVADIKLPKPETADCSECDGDGTITHDDCSDCTGHKCENCEGTGKVPLTQFVEIGLACFNAEYIRMLKSLPNCKIGPTEALKQAYFTFDGGDGLLMPVRK